MGTFFGISRWTWRCPVKKDTLDLDAPELAVYSANRAALIDYATPIFGCRARAEDVVQDAYVRFAQRRRGQDEVEQPLGYLYRIVRNLAVDALRSMGADQRRRDAQRVLLPDEPSAVSPEDALIAQDALRRVDKALSDMPERMRRAFHLYRMAGLTLQQISDELGVSVPTAHRLVREATLVLMREMQADNSSHDLKRAPHHSSLGQDEAAPPVRPEDRQAMTNTFPLPDALLEEAADWLLRLREAPQDASAQADLRTWLEADPRHLEAWRLAQRMWGASAVVLAAEGAERPSSVVVLPRQPARPRPRLSVVAALAAALAAVVVLPEGLLRVQADHRTGIGEVREIALADGSTLSLGPDSAVAIGFTADRRAVTLLRGQAFFQVEPDEGRPFVVAADPVTVRVTGTAFDVTRADDGVAVAVAKGRVSVGGAGPTQDLGSGDRLSVRTDRHQTLTGTPPEDVAAWRDGRLYASGITLGEVVSQIERHHRGVIVVRGEGLRERRVTGAFDLTNPRRALRALAESHGATMRELSPFLLVLSDP